MRRTTSKWTCLPYCSYFVVGIVCFLYGIFLGAYYIHREPTGTSTAVNPGNGQPAGGISINKPVTSTVGTKPSELFPHKDAPLAPAAGIKPYIPQNPAQPVHPAPASSSFNTVFQTRNLQQTDSPKSVLIVGGTDGSGTRRVVQVLSDLGVTMVSEDPQTYDIHADLVKGWPTIVKPVLAEVKSLNYQSSQLQGGTRSTVSRQLRQLLTLAEKDSHKPQSEILAKGGALHIRTHATASRISYGFKAPVAMTLTPLWAAELPALRVIHVVRDGRDIAFSANQGPVEKFYADMYGNSAMIPIALRGSTQRHVRAIQLWSDWNTQLQRWADEHVQQLDKQNSASGFGYMVVHSEDLVSSNQQVRVAAIARMAEFVGSSMTNKELCCLAQRDSQFMGSHDHAGDKSASALTSRYGKWHKFTDRNPQLLADLYSQGAEGLKIFGYDPLRAVDSIDMQCDVTAEDCKTDEDRAAERKLLEYLPEGKCSGTVGVDYKGGDLESMPMPEGQPGFCCSKCQETAGCKYFTVSVTPASKVCYLKSIQGTIVPNSMLVSGMVIS